MKSIEELIKDNKNKLDTLDKLEKKLNKEIVFENLLLVYFLFCLIVLLLIYKG